MPTNIKKVATDKNFRGLFIGPTGRGKTIAAASFPGKVLVIDFDRRYEPLVDWYPDRDDIDIEVITAGNYWTVFHPLIERLAVSNPYSTIILDGITGCSNTTISMQLIARGSHKDKDFAPKTTKGGIPVASWDEFNGETSAITTLLEILKGLNCNLIVTAHPVEKTTGGGNKWTSIVAYGNKLGPMIPGYFNEVYFIDYEFGLSSNDIKRVVLTRPTDRYPDCKTAMTNLPARFDITDKNFYDLLKPYIEGTAVKPTSLKA